MLLEIKKLSGATRLFFFLGLKNNCQGRPAPLTVDNK
nr:MAG TPA: hypothetical protein [Caudoviricetes sp.]